MISFIATVSFAALTSNSTPIFLNLIAAIPANFLIKSMPRRTAWGHSLYRQITGLRWYLDKGKWREEIAEKHLFLEEILNLTSAPGGTWSGKSGWSGGSGFSGGSSGGGFGGGGGGSW